MAKRVIQGEQLTQILRAGSSALADVVGVTLGPSSRNVAIERPGYTPLLVCDGVTVATATELAGPHNLALRTIKQAAAEVAEECGDGTTTVITLANDLLQRSLRLTAAGANPIYTTTQ